MVNISSIIGTGYYGEDVLHKLPWLNHLNKEHLIFIASRISPEIHSNDDIRGNLEGVIGKDLFKDTVHSIEKLKKQSKFEFIFDSTHFKKDYSVTEKEELQRWIGLSFKYLSSLDRRFYNGENNKDSRDINGLNNYIAGLIEFFKEFFTKNNIEYFINTIEDDIFSTIAYYVAKKLNIRLLGFVSSRFPKRGVMFCEDFNNVCMWNRENDTVDFFSLYDDSTIIGKQNLEKNLEYWSVKSLFKKVISFKADIHNYRAYKNYIIGKYENENFIFEPTTYRLRKFPKELLRKIIIKKIIVEPLYEEKYLLFPLHYTEDAQITFREPLVEQFDFIKKISRTLPIGYFLYVKPHPHYMGTDVSLKELYNISKLENVKIINPLIPPIKLIKNSDGVVTLNSTTGFEALIFGVPVISMGHDFYCKPDLCYLIRDLNDLPQLMIDIQENSINYDVIDNFVRMVYNNTIWIEGINYDRYRAFGLTESDGKKIALALNKILDKYVS